MGSVFKIEVDNILLLADLHLDVSAIDFQQGKGTDS